MSSSRNESKWNEMAFRILINSVAHPIEYARVLIQIGHEPFPPYSTTTLFGRPALALPNVFKYIAYIKSVDGFVGCYRGLSPKICACTISNITYQKVYEQITFENSSVTETEEETTERRSRICLDNLTRDIMCRTVAIFASQPFNVIAVRMMAEFVGGENKYSGIVSSIKEIFHENGIPGFFSGVVPRILGEVASLCIASSLTFVINSYLVDDQELKKFSAAFTTFLASAITYPFQVVSNCMAVNSSGLIAGNPPQMPLYTSWVDCWSHLSRTNQLKRGSSILYRYYTGPQIVIQGRCVAINKNDFIHSNS